jgi:hypothetical protein
MEAVNISDCAAANGGLTVNSMMLKERLWLVVSNNWMNCEKAQKGCVRLSGLAAPPEQKSQCLNHFPST